MRCRHCWRWGYRDGVLMIGCSHCGEIKRQFASVDPAGDERRAALSQDAHERYCFR